MVHSLSTTSANVHDVTEAHRLLHGGERQVWGDAGYTGVQKRPENLELAVDWQVAMKPGQRWKLEPDSAEALGGEGQGVGTGQSGASLPGREADIRLCQSMPSTPIGGTIPGPGQEHGTDGAAAGAVQPETGSDIYCPMTEGVLCPVGPDHPENRGPAGSRILEKGQIRGP